MSVTVTTAVTSVDLSYFHLSPSSFSSYLWNSHLGHVLPSHLRFLVSTKALENLIFFIVVDVNW